MLWVAVSGGGGGGQNMSAERDARAEAEGERGSSSDALDPAAGVAERAAVSSGIAKRRPKGRSPSAPILSRSAFTMAKLCASEVDGVSNVAQAAGAAPANAAPSRFRDRSGVSLP
jgi:hypothetical protein